jgi:hypothetical protein
MGMSHGGPHAAEQRGGRHHPMHFLEQPSEVGRTLTGGPQEPLNEVAQLRRRWASLPVNAFSFRAILAITLAKHRPETDPEPPEIL